MLKLLKHLVLIFGFLFPFFSFADDSKVWNTVREEISTKLGKLSIEIHFQKKDKPFVVRVIKVLRQGASPILEYFDYLPSESIQIIVEDSSLANGSATVFPTNIIRTVQCSPYQ